MNSNIVFTRTRRIEGHLLNMCELSGGLIVIGVTTLLIANH